MSKKLFLLDGMALVYRAHFALIGRPIFTSRGVNSSALYVFTNTLLDILNNQKPTHIAVAFDTDAPTQRHKEFAEYKIQREAMPEDLSAALPHVRRMIEAFNIPVLTCDGYEADDIIGTLARKAEKEGFDCYMVTPDKDFSQLVDEHTFIYKPSRMGDAVEVLGVPQVLEKWGVQRPEQVIDILALWGDTSDNIPGVPGIGEKTASKLIGQYGSVESLLQHTAELKGKVKDALEANREQALLSRRLATINCESPCDLDLEKLRLQPMNEEAVKQLCAEFEFNSIAKRLFGESFRAGRGYVSPAQSPKLEPARPVEAAPPAPAPVLRGAADVPHTYAVARTAVDQKKLAAELFQKTSVCLQVDFAGGDPKQATLRGFAFALSPHNAIYAPVNAETLETFRPVLENAVTEKVGHDLKSGFSVLKWHGVTPGGKLFDTMLVHSLVEPDARHNLGHLAEAHLGYALMPLPEKQPGQLELGGLPDPNIAERACERADVALQLRPILEPMLEQKGQLRVYHEIEEPLLPVLVDIEYEGIKIDASALSEFGIQVSKQIIDMEMTICQLAGREFNLNSPKQLGEVLFDILKICENPKKTKTGQYATDEQTLAMLAPDHEIARVLLEYRVLTKLKSTYVDTLPQAIWPKTGRVHTTFNQTATSTGRLNSGNPNVQNIPIRTEQGREIRRAFVPRGEGFVLLSADYSQIELRIIAALSNETALLDAFARDIDIHTATAARVYGVGLNDVTPEMRRKAKMVNYGIAYGISAFGLAQRLTIPRKEALAIMSEYFTQFPAIKKFMTNTIEFARRNGYVETVTGRRRYIRDITSSNATIRGSAERNAVNAPIQGSAADMIKIAMVNIHRELQRRQLRTRMLLTVHDELVFDLYEVEKSEVLPLIEEKMKTAIKLNVPIIVEMGVGQNWLEAH
ncbi:MAG: DNA polymerase I [Verrucomicrobia subdivision 3 bacterium]|nr:DNA polymerase I [Limisphaerales bacterium]